MADGRYKARINSKNPGCLVFLLDQSGSMNDDFGRVGGASKAQALCDSVNKLLSTTIIRCAKDAGIKPWFDIAVIGYTTNEDGSQDRIGPALADALAGKIWVPVKDLQDSAAIEQRTKKVPDGAGGLVDKTVDFPVWVKPVAQFGTPIKGAMGYLKPLVESWVAEHQDSFPPVIFHVTDGEATDGDFAPAAAALTSVATKDGQALLFNIHLSGRGAEPALLPASEAMLPDDFAKALYRASSPLPEAFFDVARDGGLNPSAGSRCFAYNADAVAMIQMLDLGSTMAQKQLL